MSQLALPLTLADHAVFRSYLDTGNETLVATLKALAAGSDGPGCWMWGTKASGKTHLLQALCDHAGDRSIYVPLELFCDSAPQVLDGLASRAIVCLDDIQTVAGDPDWEYALFDLCNQLSDADGQLVVAASSAPRASGFGLNDLESRLSRLPVFHLQALDENSRGAALQLRARHRGLDLPDDTARYLLSRNRRDMASLYDVLDRLDSAALQAQRRLTIPFVKDVLQQP